MKRIRLVITILLGGLLSFFSACEKGEETVNWTQTQSGGSQSGLSISTITSPWAGSLFTVDFRNPAEVYIGGTASNLLQSTDTGSSWTLLPSSILYCCQDVDFNTSSFYTTDIQGNLYRSSNDAATWTQVDANTQYGFTVNDIHLGSATDGIAVCDFGDFSITQNGITWVGTRFTNIFDDFYDISQVGFSSTSVLVVGENGRILRSSDYLSGNWNAISSPAGLTDLRAIDFPSYFAGYIVGNGGTILKSDNGGYSWADISPNTTEILYGVAFKDEFTGVAVGANGTILYTSNGGATWSTLFSGTTAGLNDVEYNAGRWVICGYSGTIIVIEE